LDAELRKISGAKTRSGRPRALPGNRAEARRQIIARLSPELRWLTDLKSKPTCNNRLEMWVDSAIAALFETSSKDQLQLARLKKRKLRLRDEISMLEDQLIPDIIA